MRAGDNHETSILASNCLRRDFARSAIAREPSPVGTVPPRVLNIKQYLLVNGRHLPPLTHLLPMFVVEAEVSFIFSSFGYSGSDISNIHNASSP